MLRTSHRFQLADLALVTCVTCATTACALDATTDDPTGTVASPLTTLVQCASFSKDAPTIEDVSSGTATACSAGTSTVSILGSGDETAGGAGSYEAFGPGAIGTTIFNVTVPSGAQLTQLDVVMRIFVCNGDDGTVASTLSAQRLDGTWQTLATTAGRRISPSGRRRSRSRRWARSSRQA